MAAVSNFATYELLAQDPARAADVLAGEGSTGTFVEVEGESAALQDRFAITVERLELLGEPDADGATRARLVAGLPADLLGSDLTTLLASVAGNVSEVAQASTVRLVELALSDDFLRACPRPAHGLDGTRSQLGVPERPLRAAMIEPGWRPGPEQLARRAAALFAAGADLVRDPLTTADPSWCPLAERVRAVEEVVRTHEQERGRRVLFAYAIDDEPAATVRHAELLAGAGARCAALSATALGLSAVTHLRRRTDLVLHARSAPQALLSRDGTIGVADEVVQAIWRLAGLDHLPVPAASAGDGGVAVRARLTPLLDASDRALPVVPVALAADADGETDVLLTSEETSA
ncbi:MAG TPA: RuBisCO large subunit C-terminal-like domain-containing protein [Conexibacter sp.]|nr:RuBisCO large subunit C-terminal-like domain-containing protein [Conexibacter sp.]